MKNGMMIFEKAEFGKVRVVRKSGTFWFVAKDVAEALGYRNSSEAVRDNCKYVEILKSSHELLLDIPSRGLQIIPESDLYRLVMKSQLPSAEKFQDWVVEEVLPSIRKTGGYQMGAERTERDEFDMGMMALDAAARLLNMSEVSKLACLKNLCGEFNVSTAGLPKTLPRPVQILSATELLKRAGKVITIHQFNQKMLDAGLLEMQTRPSTNGKETRTFKALTEKGLQYGENSVNPDYPLETHPYYFTDKFSELVQFLMATIHKDILED